MAIEKAVKKRGPGRPFQPGKPGGPGRPKGSRSRLSEAFLSAVCQDFEAHGAAAIEAARVMDPIGYVRVIAGLLPKKIEVANAVADMTDEELQAIIRRELNGGDEVGEEVGGSVQTAVH